MGDTNKLYINFEIDVPDSPRKSEVNTLILQLNEYRQTVEWRKPNRM